VTARANRTHLALGRWSVALLSPGDVIAQILEWLWRTV
jgi:hypothetical protein